MRHIDRGISTLAVALSDYVTVPELTALARLTKSTAPGPKPDLAKHILESLEGDRLRIVWQCLGWVTVRIPFDDEEQALFVALGFGPRAEVIEPAGLRERVEREIAAMSERTVERRSL